MFLCAVNTLVLVYKNCRIPGRCAATEIRGVGSVRTSRGGFAISGLRACERFVLICHKEITGSGV